MTMTESAWGGERPRPSNSSSSGRGTKRPQRLQGASHPYPCSRPQHMRASRSPLHRGPFRTQKCEPVAAGFEPTRTLCSGCHRSITSRFKSTSLTIACEEFHSRTNDQTPFTLTSRSKPGVEGYLILVFSVSVCSI